jgi:RHS repeat-associated protein
MDLAPRLRHPTYPRRPWLAGCDHESAEQPAAISGATPASFQYDAFGRRVQKTLGNTATALLYDGPNAVQERVGSSVTNLLAGRGIDEQLTRADSTGTRTLLGDILGSTVALVGGSGVDSEYTYEPFGRLTSAPTSNAYQYTGRENDGTGLYYYRARYYHPTLQRFISEDPLGFGGGDLNLYAYVGNSPTSYADPLGLCVPMYDAGKGSSKSCGHGGGSAGAGRGGLGGPGGAGGSGRAGMGEGPICRAIGGCRPEQTSNPPPSTAPPKPCGGGSGDLPPVLYRGGTSRSPSDYTVGPDGGISFFASPQDAPHIFKPGRPYFGIDPSLLPSGSVIPDAGMPVRGGFPGEVYPPGHHSIVNCTREQVENAITFRGKMPK